LLTNPGVAGASIPLPAVTLTRLSRTLALTANTPMLVPPATVASLPATARSDSTTSRCVPSIFTAYVASGDSIRGLLPVYFQSAHPKPPYTPT
jgi:hypothetical protein